MSKSGSIELRLFLYFRLHPEWVTLSVTRSVLPPWRLSSDWREPKSPQPWSSLPSQVEADRKNSSPLSQPSAISMYPLIIQDTKDQHALESAASLHLLQTHSLLALQLRCRGANYLNSTLCPRSLPSLSFFPTLSFFLFLFFFCIIECWIIPLPWKWLCTNVYPCCTFLLLSAWRSKSILSLLPLFLLIMRLLRENIPYYYYFLRSLNYICIVNYWKQGITVISSSNVALLLLS